MSDTFHTAGEEGRSEERRQRPTEEREAPRAERRVREEDADTGDRVWTFGNMGRQSARPTMGGISDGALALMIKVFEAKSYDSPNLPAEIARGRFRLIPLDGQTANVPQSAMLVCLPIDIGASKLVLTYILIIENPGEPVTRVLQERGDSYDAIVLPEDMLSQRYLGVVKDQVSGMGSEFVMVGSQVILADTVAELNEKDDNRRIAAIFDNAMDAICGYRENIIDHVAGTRSAATRITPKALRAKERLEVGFSYSGQQIQDSSGLPIRSDVVSTMYHSQQTPDDIEMYIRSEIAEVRAGLDLVISYGDDTDDRPRFGGGRRRHSDRPEPFWRPVINITSITAPAKVPFNLELAQLALSMIALQSNDYRWATILRPTNRPSGKDLIKPLTELKYLWLMHPDEDKACIYDDLSSNISDAELGDFLDDTVRQDPAFGLTIPSSGEKSWVLGIYERIAMTQDRALIETLYDSADTLTGNHFRAVAEDMGLLDRGELPVATTGTRALLGYWLDSDGNKRDLREWGVAALLSYTNGKSPDLIRDYQATFEDSRYSLDRNLAERYSILRKLVPGVHVTGTAEQLVFNTDYIAALSEALDRARMSPYVSGSEGLNTRRKVGHTAYDRYTASNLGVARRGREDTPRNRRRGWSGGSYF